jgi:aminoglycoside phosphotransferase (APT) family kinase protein
VTSPPDTTDPDVVRTILRTNEPLELLLHGDEFDTWRVGGGVVVKFPTNESDAEKVPLELAVDALARPRVGDLMPPITVMGGPSTDFPWPYLGYAAAPGIQGQTAAGVTIRAGAGLSRGLGSFLERLHEIDEDEAHAAGIGDRKVSFELPSLTEATVEATSEIAPGEAVRRFLDEKPPAPSPERVLCHTDLKGEHLFVDESCSRLTAVIDWADAEVCDPAFDLAGVVGWLGPAIAREMAETAGAGSGWGGPQLADRAIWLARAGILAYWNLVVAGETQAPFPVIASQLRAAFGDDVSLL